MRVIVAGAGISGCAAALAIHRAGHEAVLLERAERIEPLGAALSIWGNAMAALDDLGCGAAVRARAAPVRSVTLSRANGRTLVGPVDLSDTDSRLPTRAALQDILLYALEPGVLRLGCNVDDVRCAEGGVEAIADGQTIEKADCAVIADGIWSRFGADLSGAPRYAGYGGALALGAGGSDLGDGFANGHAEEIWGERERFGLFAAQGDRPYWFYMQSAAAQHCMTLTHADILARAASFPRRIAEAVAATPPDAVTNVAIHAKPPPRSLGHGRIVAIGDAAHPMEPNQGQGACQGIEDAWALGKLLGSVPADALAEALERARLKRVRGFVRESALIGRMAHGESAMLRRLAQGAMAAIPRAMDARQLRARLQPVSYG